MTVKSIRWVPSPHFNRKFARVIKAIVIHTAECPEVARADEGVASWFANPQSKVSAHYVVDADSITQCVRDELVAWHAGPVNDWTLGIELCGKAGQDDAGWADEYSMSELRNAAALVAQLCETYAIPAVRTAVNDIRSEGAGIYGHSDVTAAYGHKGGHWDPGPKFPFDTFLAMVAGYLEPTLG